MPADPARVRSLFLQAADLPRGERPAFIAAVPDAAERAELARLLNAHAAPDARLDATAAAPDPGATYPAPSDDTAAHSSGDVGTTVAGRYRLVERIGEGGMGTVWTAQQTDPVKRTVAVKLVKAGMDSKAVLARFDAERQALALMDHPNIATVLDGGLHAGRPYFVMELVKGTPITDFCDARRLTPRQRLELFVPVCQAIQHAHQKGVIHRDIKPSNVLVALYDDRPVPKVIDFGVAKATGAALTDQSLVTGFGAVLGTPEYMSPEQASFNNLDVDTRSDVYSLGVLLYELLTGTTPVDRKSLGQAALLEMLRIVREVEAPRPSAKLSTSQALPSIAASRGTEPAKLSKLMRGELDWLVLKALEKDRTRRYDTANGLARDIQRYLADEVVEARPPTAGYRLRKFVRRHKGQVLAAGLVLAALLAGFAGTVAGLVEARRQEGAAVAAREDADAKRADAETARQAEADQRQKAEAARQAEAVHRRTAEAKEAEAVAVVKFFEAKVFAAGRPKGQYGGLGRDVSLRDAIAASLPSLARGFADQPLVAARLRVALGTTFLYLGDPQAAVKQLEQARVIYNERLPPDNPDALDCMDSLASSYAELGRYADALRLREKTLAALQRVLGPDHPVTLVSMKNLADSYIELGRGVDALRLAEETLAASRRVLGPDHPNTLLCMVTLASCYDVMGRQADALRLREETLVAMRRVLGPDHPDTILGMGNLAGSYDALGRQAEALRLREEALAADRRVLGADHPGTIMDMYNLAVSYAALDRHADAVSLYEEAFRRQNSILGPRHAATLRSLTNLIASLRAIGRDAEALPLTDEFLNRAKGVAVSGWVRGVCDHRCMCFLKLGNGAGCRDTADKWEAFGFARADNLYNAGCFRAIAAGVYAKANQPAEATADADRAIAWLIKAVAAGFKDRAHIAKDADLDALRGRADFRALLASLPEVAPMPRPAVH